jgi:hypothetical protein
MSDDKTRSDKPLIKTAGLEGSAHADLVNPTVTFEERDVNINSIVYFGIGLTVTVIFCWFVIWGTFTAFETHFTPEKRSNFPMAAGERGRLPSGVRLEQVQKIAEHDKTPYSEDVSAARNKADQVQLQAPELSRYGWVDEKQGTIHVPVDVAIGLVVKKYSEKIGKMPESPYLSAPRADPAAEPVQPSKKDEEKPKAAEKKSAEK